MILAFIVTGVVGVLVGHILAHSSKGFGANSNDICEWDDHSYLGFIFGGLTRRLERIQDEISSLRHEVKQMSTTNPTLDQAVTDLDAAVTSKIAEDQVLNTEAAQGLNEAADVAKVEALVDKLNTETAAEKAAQPAPVDVTVTGTNANGQSVPEAPVDTSAAAPTTQVVDAKQA